MKNINYSTDRYGLVKTSLIDFPGRLSCVIFVPGCNFHCPYCHNKSLISPPYDDCPYSLEEILNFLDKRKKVLEGMVITGGEPLLEMENILPLLEKAENLGYKIKIDTNGSRPENLKKIISKVDYVAMDIKTSPDQYYPGFTKEEPKGTETISQTVMESVKILANSSTNYEFRITPFPGIHKSEDIISISDCLPSGSTLYFNKLQNYNGFAPEKLASWIEILNINGIRAILRNHE